MQHLAALRHEKIAFITGPLRLKSAVARQQAFLRSMQEIGLESDPALIVEGDHTMEGGMAAFTRLLAGPVRPTAVFCSNDMTAIGVMRESHDAGLSIPVTFRWLDSTTFASHNSCCHRLPPCRCRNRSWLDWPSTHSSPKWSEKPRRPTGPSTCLRPVWCCANQPACFRGLRRQRKNDSGPRPANIKRPHFSRKPRDMGHPDSEQIRTKLREVRIKTGPTGLTPVSEPAWSPTRAGTCRSESFP